VRLTEWSQHKELEEILGDLLYTVRQSPVMRAESRRRGTKGELASALVIRHGIDLLADGEIRAAVSSRQANHRHFSGDTPFRLEYLGDDPKAGTRELLEIFRQLLEPSGTLGTGHPRVVLQNRLILATPEFRTIETGVRVKMPDSNGEESPSDERVEEIDRSLAIRTNKPERRPRVLDRAAQECATTGRRGLP